MSITACKDHLGQDYKSLRDMCNAYCISEMTYRDRLKKGWKLKDILTKPTRLPVKDPDGKIFKTQREMCKYYKIPFATFRGRLLRGKSLKEALKPMEDVTKIKHIIYDHKNNIFESCRKLCTYWDIPTTTFLRYVNINDKNIITISEDELVKIKFTPRSKHADYIVLKCVQYPYYLIKHDNKEYIINAKQALNDYYKKKGAYISK